MPMSTNAASRSPKHSVLSHGRRGTAPKWVGERGVGGEGDAGRGAAADAGLSIENIAMHMAGATATASRTQYHLLLYYFVVVQVVFLILFQLLSPRLLRLHLLRIYDAGGRRCCRIPGNPKQ